MTLKRVGTLLTDVLDMMSRVQLLGQLLTLTKPGQVVISTVIALGVLITTALRSDPLMAIGLFTLGAFAAVTAIVHFVFQLKLRPHLQHGNIVGLQYELGEAKFGTEEGGYMWGESFLRPLVVRISNTQKRVDVPANNARAAITYEHDDTRDKIRANAMWITQGRRGVETVHRCQIESDQTALLVYVYEYPPAPNQTVPNAKRTNDYLAAGDIFPNSSQYKKFIVGHWNVSIEVISDNSAPLLLKGGFTITRDERIEFDKPVALRKLGTFPKPFQSRPVIDFHIELLLASSNDFFGTTDLLG
jgi:hypothetical protein